MRSAANRGGAAARRVGIGIYYATTDRRYHHAAQPIRVGALFLDLTQRRFSGTGKHVSRRLEPRAMARAIPRLLGDVPRHLAAEMRAGWRKQDGLAVIIAIRGDARAVQFKNLPFPSLQRSQRATFGTRKAIANEVV